MKVRDTYPAEYIHGNENNVYDDDNIPEIDLPKTTDDTNIIPDEVPRRDGPGGE